MELHHRVRRPPPLPPGSKAKRLSDAQAALAGAKAHHLVLKDKHDAMCLKLSKSTLALENNNEHIQKLTAEVAAAHAECSPPVPDNGALSDVDGEADVSDGSFEAEERQDVDMSQISDEFTTPLPPCCRTEAENGGQTEIQT